MKNLIILAAFGCCQIHAQVLEPGSLDRQGMSPETALSSLAAGYGYDPLEQFSWNFWRPDEYRFYGRVGLAHNPSAATYSSIHRPHELIFDNIKAFLPQVRFIYVNSGFGLDLSWQTTSLGYRSTPSSSSTFKMLGNQLNIVAHTEIQTSLLFTCGLHFSSFDQTYDTGAQLRFVRTKPLFDRPQLSIGLEYASEFPLSGYLMVQSEQVGIQPLTRVESPNQVVHAGPFALSYPGVIGYGIRLQPNSSISLTAEMGHHFLVVDEEQVFQGVTLLHKHDIWNNDIVLGASAEPSDFLNIGVRYSRYLAFTDLYMNNVTTFPGEKPYTSNNPFAIEASATFRLTQAELSVLYRHNEMSYSVSGDIVEERRAETLFFLLAYYLP